VSAAMSDSQLQSSWEISRCRAALQSATLQFCALPLEKCATLGIYCTYHDIPWFTIIAPLPSSQASPYGNQTPPTGDLHSLMNKYATRPYLALPKSTGRQVIHAHQSRATSFAGYKVCTELRLQLQFTYLYCLMNPMR